MATANNRILNRTMTNQNQVADRIRRGLHLMFPTLLFLTVMLCSLKARAEDPRYAFVYLCKSAEMNERIVNACTGKFPELTTRGSSVLMSWQTRNASSAQRGKEVCASELLKHYSSSAQVDKAKAGIDRLENFYLEVIERSIKDKGIVVCNDFLTMLELPESDLTKLPLWTDEERVGEKILNSEPQKNRGDGE